MRPMSTRRVRSRERRGVRVSLLVAAVLSTGAAGQADDPRDSSKVLSLRSFATFTTGSLSGSMDLDHPKDGSGRIFVSTNEGKIYGFSSTGEPLGVFLDVGAPGVLPDFNADVRFGITGLSYIAFHPDYGVAGAAGEGKLYTYYRTEVPGLREADYSGAALPSRPGDVLSQYAVTEWTADPADPDRVDTGSRREVIRFELSGLFDVSHSAGSLGFNPFAMPGAADYGMLWIPVGDMYSDGTVPNWQHVQDRDNPFGKILRIDPLANGNDPYAVPGDNPFSDGGALLDDDGNTEEIASWGFRNPQNMSFAKDERGIGRLIVFDIGADRFEEINLVDLADNHGWTRYDGPEDGNLDTEIHLPAGSVLEFPATVYDHEIPNLPGAEPTAGPTAISGGFVVSDPSDPEFRDQVLFGDLPRGAFFHAGWDALLSADSGDTQAPTFVMSVSVDGSEPGAFPDLIGSGRGDPRFGLDESGRLFVISRNIDTVFLTDLVADQSPGCVADWNADGLVDTRDFLAYLNDWSGDDAGADLNDDGTVNTLDFLVFLGLFAAGCG